VYYWRDCACLSDLPARDTSWHRVTSYTLEATRTSALSSLTLTAVPQAVFSTFSETATSLSQGFGGRCAVWRKAAVARMVGRR